MPYGIEGFNWIDFCITNIERPFNNITMAFECYYYSMDDCLINNDNTISSPLHSCFSRNWTMSAPNNAVANYILLSKGMHVEIDS